MRSEHLEYVRGQHKFAGGPQVIMPSEFKLYRTNSKFMQGNICDLGIPSRKYYHSPPTSSVPVYTARPTEFGLTICIQPPFVSDINLVSSASDESGVVPGDIGDERKDVRKQKEKANSPVTTFGSSRSG